MKKKAFTLTELLVCVVIIGVLAVIVLPKYTKMLEGRRTLEAEEMMQAIRNEQEARCMLDKPYRTDLTKLATVPANVGSNFTYANLAGKGVEATRPGKNYSLQIPSYADGRICCSGTGCDSLDKNYPKCEDLTNKTKTPDFVETNANCVAVSSGCEGEDCDVEPDEPEPPVCSSIPATLTETKVCGCNNDGIRTRTFNTETCSWGTWTSCNTKETDCPECQEGATQGESCACGNKSYQTCEGGKWVSKTGTCPLTQEEKASCECDTQDNKTEPCPEGYEGTKTMKYNCNQSTGQWEPAGWDESACKPLSCTPKASDAELTTECFTPGVSYSGDTCDGVVNAGRVNDISGFCSEEDKKNKKTCTDYYTIPIENYRCEEGEGEPEQGMQIQPGEQGIGDYRVNVTGQTYQQWRSMIPCNGQTYQEVKAHELHPEEADPAKVCQSYYNQWKCAYLGTEKFPCYDAGHPNILSESDMCVWGFKVECKNPNEEGGVGAENPYQGKYYKAFSRTIQCCPDSN